jgi:hypothetical protein
MIMLLFSSMGKALGVTSFMGFWSESYSIDVYSGQGCLTASLAPGAGAWRLESIAAPDFEIALQLGVAAEVLRASRYGGDYRHTE